MLAQRFLVSVAHSGHLGANQDLGGRSDLLLCRRGDDGVGMGGRVMLLLLYDSRLALRVGTAVVDSEQLVGRGLD